MFTGIIEEIGEVIAAKREGDGMVLSVRASRVLSGTAKGDSICISGACQTVTAVNERSFTVFVSPVTLAVTTLGTYKGGFRVNLERALSPSSRLGGHFVQGHVDGKGRISRIERDAAGMRVALSVPEQFRRYLVERGSLAVDGISLTIVSISRDGCSLYLVPETIASTTAGEWKVGDEVNIEVDLIAKYVERILEGLSYRGGGSGIMAKLIEEGFA